MIFWCENELFNKICNGKEEQDGKEVNHHQKGKE